MLKDRKDSRALRNRLGSVVTFSVAAACSWGIASQAVLAPQPAQAVAKLGGSSGASAAAVYTTTTPISNIVVWPNVYTAGSSAPAGTPCSNINLAPGAPVTKQIQVIGSMRRCWPIASTTSTACAAAPANPNPNPIVVTQATLNGTAQGVQVTTQPTAILKWPELWSTTQPTPVAGTACSPVDMLPGETTQRHVQLWVEGGPWSRCVDITLPAYAN